MIVTRVKYNLQGCTGNHLANCTLVLNDCFMVHDVEYRQGEKGAYLRMPTRNARGRQESLKKGRTGDVVHPLNSDLTGYLLKIVGIGLEEAYNTGALGSSLWYDFIPTAAQQGVASKELNND